MKERGASDLWDVIIERYCSKEERKLINEMSEDDYSDLVFAFDDMLLEIENRIKRFGEGKKECFEKGYKIVDTMFNGYKQQAREEMLKEIPCPQMTNSSISECVCEWCKSFKEEKLGEGEKK